MRFGVVLRYIGMVLLIEAAFMLVAGTISFFNGFDSGFAPLVLSAILTAIMGVFPLMYVRKPTQISSKEGYAIVTGAWILSCFVGTFPYLMWGGEFSVVNAWFESVSGFTTTGSTILNDVEALPKGLLFWRSATQLLGGTGVVMFSLAIMPAMGRGRQSFSTVEMSSLAKDNFRYRTKKILTILLYVYIGMAVLETILLRSVGMGWFDAVTHSFSTVATGGFSTRNMSIAAFDSVAVEGIISVFMLLSGIHFGLIFMTITGSRMNVFRSEVVRYYVLCIAAGVAIITFSLWNAGTYGTLGDSLRYGVFQSISVISTTSFATADTTLWTPLAMVVLLFFTIQCACAGSTSGGIKADRVLLAFKVMRTRIRLQRHPSAVIRIKLNGQVQSEDAINFAMQFIVAYFLFAAGGAIINAAAGEDFVTGITSSIACLSNVGSGFGEVGSMSNYAGLPVVSKLSSTALMLFGRLEIFGLIQLFFIKTWM